MARRGRTFTRGGRQVRETLWIGIGATVTQLNAINTSFRMNALNVAALSLRPFTIVRSRGFFGVRSDQSTADESFGAAIGYSVVSDQAIAIGVTAFPTPIADQGSDLFYVYETIMGRFNFVSGVGFHPNSVIGHAFDSKAMRRVNDDQDVSFVVESDGFSTGVTVHHTSRMLIKLH